MEFATYVATHIATCVATEWLSEIFSGLKIRYDDQKTHENGLESPLEAADLSPAQAGGEFRVEEVVPDIILLNDCHEYIQLFIC